MRRLAFLSFAVAAGLIALGAPVAAEPDAGLNREVSGAFSGTSVFDNSTPACSFVHQVHEAAYTTANGRSGSFQLDGCVVSQGLFYSGVFVLTTPNGAVLNGTVTGFVGGAGPGACLPPLIPAALNFTLAVTQGTKNFGHVTGTIDLSGTWCAASAGVPGPISGTLTGELQRL
jgi:hypothetical protein